MATVTTHIGATTDMSATFKGKEDPFLPLFTRILPVEDSEIGTTTFSAANSYMHPWTFTPSASTSGMNLSIAADALHTSLNPVAFPTETVYGLGANALSSAAVRGIYKAKQRPSDNPLIVHVSSLEMLRRLLDPFGIHEAAEEDPIPPIYHPLISAFWPGPLSILLPNPAGSKIAPEVVAGQPTFAARMPSSPLALALIQLSNLPLAAPSANASTKPSPTRAEHVYHDLQGRIEYILDGGPCAVGVESTVVDGLSDPPAILRPGGIGIEQLRQIKGWENVIIAYKDVAAESDSHMANGTSEANSPGPRAPGMKYKHYSPAARVILADAGVEWVKIETRLKDELAAGKKVGVLRTRNWPDQLQAPATATASVQNEKGDRMVYLNIGPSTQDVAKGLFSALRSLDLQSVDIILVEGICDEQDREKDNSAAAVMNRLRKAASERIALDA